jgi:hypothetical protein
MKDDTNVSHAVVGPALEEPMMLAIQNPREHRHFYRAAFAHFSLPWFSFRRICWWARSPGAIGGGRSLQRHHHQSLLPAS